MRRRKIDWLLFTLGIAECFVAAILLDKALAMTGISRILTLIYVTFLTAWAGGLFAVAVLEKGVEL